MNRDYAYCHGKECTKQKQCNRWLGNHIIEGLPLVMIEYTSCISTNNSMFVDKNIIKDKETKMSKFKIGDWVRYVGNSGEACGKCVGTIRHIDDTGVELGNGSTFGFDKGYLELWEPTEGEWVCMKDFEIDNLYAVFQYKSIRERREVYPLEFIQTLRDSI